MDIRSAREGDAESIARLHIASWQATYRKELPAEFLDAQDLGPRTAGWRSEIAQPSTVVLLAEDEAALVGFVACGPARDAGVDASGAFEIYNLHVAASFQGRGIGSTLFEAALEAGRAAGATELTLWVVRTNAGARRFYERRGMEADGAEQTHPVGPGAELREVRYRVAVPEGPHRAAPPHWKLLQPIEKEQRPESRWSRLALAPVLLVSLLAALFVFYPGVLERVAGVAAQRQLDADSLAQARRAAQIEVQALLRPIAHQGNIGVDREARAWRLGLAYGRLALIEERANDPARRDHYFLLARRALREAGVKDPTDEFIRASVRTEQPKPR